LWIRKLPLLTQTQIDAWHKERLASQRALLGPDDGIQRVIDALKAKGQLDNTMIIFLGDHGFSWGSHRYVLKHCGYEECVRFPMLIRYPGLSGNRDENRLVSNVDLASTMAEFAGVTPALPQNGKSLVSIITNTATSWDESVLMEVRTQGLPKFYGVRVPGWKYLEYDNGDKELYDITADPYEMQNQANQSSYAAKQAELAQLMRTMRGF
jgi:arylsulfatase A-like enzyme